MDDLSTELERSLGKLVKQKYDTDFYIIHRCAAISACSHSLVAQVFVYVCVHSECWRAMVLH